MVSATLAAAQEEGNLCQWLQPHPYIVGATLAVALVGTVALVGDLKLHAWIEAGGDGRPGALVV